MKPVNPKIKGLPVIEFAKNQSQYCTLPAVRLYDGTVISRWRLGMIERLKVLFTGDLYLYISTFNNPIQPVILNANKPKIDYLT